MARFKAGQCLVFPTGRNGEYSVTLICVLPFYSVLIMQALAFGVMTSVKTFIMNNRWIRDYVRFLVVLL